MRLNNKLMAIKAIALVLLTACSLTPNNNEKLISQAEQGNAIAQANLGGMYRKGRGVEQDYEEAVKWYRQAAEQGHAIAQTNLGWMYRKGRGVEQDV